MHHDDESRQKQITGVISLEDVLEAVIQDEIIDETDNFVDVNAPTTGVVQRGKHRRDLSQFMALFEHKIRKLSSLTAAEINAIAAFLTTNVKTFAPWKDSLEGMKKLIQTSQLVEYHDEKAETAEGVRTYISPPQKWFRVLSPADSMRPNALTR